MQRHNFQFDVSISAIMYVEHRSSKRDHQKEQHSTRSFSTVVACISCTEFFVSIWGGKEALDVDSHPAISGRCNQGYIYCSRDPAPLTSVDSTTRTESSLRWFCDQSHASTLEHSGSFHQNPSNVIAFSDTHADVSGSRRFSLFSFLF